MSLNPFGNPDFARNATDLVERYVGLVRDNATTKVISVARLVVFGIVAAVGAFIACILGIIVFTRLLQWLISAQWMPLDFDHGSSVWLSYLIVGGLFSAIGVFCMRQRHPHAD